MRSVCSPLREIVHAESSAFPNRPHSQRFAIYFAKTKGCVVVMMVEVTGDVGVVVAVGGGVGLLLLLVVVVAGGKIYEKFPQIHPFWFTEMDEFDGWDTTI